MTEQESYQSFIVRIWFENSETDGEHLTRRGMIEHVSSGKRRYFKSLDDIGPNIARWLDDPAPSPNSIN